MSFEIERKFLVYDDSWRNSGIRQIKIRQAYLASDANVSIRVRVRQQQLEINSQNSLVKAEPTGI
jgi:CYTH domain-containing protein